MFDLDPIDDLYHPFHRRLTTEDVEHIEEGVNFLVSYIYAHDQEALAEQLERDLPHKLREYIQVADDHKSDPKLSEIATILGNEMRALLKLVNAYYYKLN